ncbi:MAG: hypothetical protein R3D67_16295 [Hyphomicrobiaceae bacterium]
MKVHAKDLSGLQRTWRDLVCPPASRSAADGVFKQLAAAYSEDNRHYHTLRHIEVLLDLASSEAARFNDRRAVDLAIFFHNAIYDVTRKSNESASAALAQVTLRAFGFDQAFAARVAHLIEATAHFEATQLPTIADDPDLARFIDLDLSILAQPTPTYDAYVKAVRREYAFLSDERYRIGRAQVLESFLERKRLYRCSDHHAAWDAAARANMRRELASLQS